MRRLGLGVISAAAFVVATGLWTSPALASVDQGIDSPGEGDVTSTRVVNVQIHASSDSSQGLQYVRLELEGPGFAKRRVWCAPAGDSCPSWSSGEKTSYTGSFSWDTGSLTTYNGEYTLYLMAKENNGTISNATPTRVKVNTPPATPSWTSITSTTTGGKPKMVLRWRANSEPDIVSYKITRSANNGGPNTFFKVDSANPSSQGCSRSGDTFTCTDDAFPSSGYGGSYTYYLAATRTSPVTAAGVSSAQSPRAVSISEPKPSPSTGGGGRGGSGGTGGTGGTGGAGGNAGTPSANPFTPGASLTPTPDPDAVDPRDFYTGTFQTALPYTQRNSVVLGTRTDRTNIAGFAGEEDEITLDVRKTLLPIAGGLFTLTAALHFRRIIRDH